MLPMDERPGVERKAAVLKCRDHMEGAVKMWSASMERTFSGEEILAYESVSQLESKNTLGPNLCGWSLIRFKATIHQFPSFISTAPPRAGGGGGG